MNKLILALLLVAGCAKQGQLGISVKFPNNSDIQTKSSFVELPQDAGDLEVLIK